MNGELSRLGERIKRQRQRLGMTQAELAGDDVTRNMLSRIENGAALPSLPTLVALASRLGIPVGALLDDPEDYLEYRLVGELRRLYAVGNFKELLDKFASLHIDRPGDELSTLLTAARIGYARELFAVGRLGDAMDQLREAERLAEECAFDMTAAGEQIFLLRLMMDACPALSAADDGEQSLIRHRDRLRAAIFDENELAIYLYCRSELAASPWESHSHAHPDAEAIRARLAPFADGLREPLYREHIAAKLDMISAEYLDAKAKLSRIAGDNVPPSILYELIADLEICCKCCGDFENAYKYAGRRLELIKRIV